MIHSPPNRIIPTNTNVIRTTEIAAAADTHEIPSNGASLSFDSLRENDSDEPYAVDSISPPILLSPSSSVSMDSASSSFDRRSNLSDDSFNGSLWSLLSPRSTEARDMRMRTHFILAIFLTAAMTACITWMVIGTSHGINAISFYSSPAKYQEFTSGLMFHIVPITQPLEVDANTMYEINHDYEVPELMHERDELGMYVDSSRQADLPFYCDGNSWLYGEWNSDGTQFTPTKMQNPTTNQFTYLSHSHDIYHDFSGQEIATCLEQEGGRITITGSERAAEMAEALKQFIAPIHIDLSPVPARFDAQDGKSEDDRISVVTVSSFDLQWKFLQSEIPKFTNSTILTDIFEGDLTPIHLSQMNGDEDMVEAMYLFQLTRFIRLCQSNGIRLIWLTPSKPKSDMVESDSVSASHDYFLQRVLGNTVRTLNDHSVPWIDLWTMSQNFRLLSRSSDDSSVIQPNNYGHVLHSDKSPQTYHDEVVNSSLTHMQLQMILNYVCGCREIRRSAVDEFPYQTGYIAL